MQLDLEIRSAAVVARFLVPQQALPVVCGNTARASLCKDGSRWFM